MKFLRKIYGLLEKQPLVFCALASMLIALLLETFNRRSPLKALAYIATNPIMFIVNALIVLLTLSAVALCRRRIFALLVIFICWLGLGVANFVILGMRVTPFSATDLMMIEHCFSITSHYLSAFAIAAIIAGFVAAGICLVLVWRKAPRVSSVPNRKKAFMSAAAVAVVSLCIVTAGAGAYVDATQTENIVDSYDKFGFAYCFSSSIFGTGINRPDDYSESLLSGIRDRLDAYSPKPECEPDIIFLQLESFMDVNEIEGLELDSDPTPVFTALKNGYPSGHLTVPTVGAGTVNTEFEVLTGMNLKYFGMGEYPYKTVLRRETCESLAYGLGAYGYTATAIHNNVGSFYGRQLVFPNLGFDRFVPIEYMEDPAYNEYGWAEDSMLTAQILKSLDSTDGKDFVFAISVQAHGRYPSSGSEDECAPIDGIWDESEAWAFDYYLTQLSEVDAFLGELTAALEARGEPVVLVLYGDHLPALDIPAEVLESGSIYTTDYVIWNNLGLDADDADLTSYQLGSRVMSMLGLDGGTMFDFHALYSGTEGYDDLLEQLEYDMLYGDRIVCGTSERPQPVDMEIGISPVSVSRVEYVQGDLLVYGENFTPYSVVIINGHHHTTVYNNSGLLTVERCHEPDTTDEITVGQVSKDRVVLSRTAVVYLK